MAFIALLIFLLAIGTADELTGQAVHAFVTLKPYVPSCLGISPLLTKAPQ